MMTVVSCRWKFVASSNQHACVLSYLMMTVGLVESVVVVPGLVDFIQCVCRPKLVHRKDFGIAHNISSICIYRCKAGEEAGGTTTVSKQKAALKRSESSKEQKEMPHLS